MSQTPVSEVTFASGRYSKRKRTQVTYHMDDLDFSDSESECDVVQIKKRKATAPKPLPKTKVFPFMELPAEIRNMIYSHVLADPSGINLIATFKNKRRTVERVSEELMTSHYGGQFYWKSVKVNDQTRDQYKEATALVPSLLAVSKQINREGYDILYSNEFIFADSFALYSFIINLGPAGAKHLKNLRLLSWGHGRAMKAYNHSCFAVLSWATNLENLHLSQTSSYVNNPKAAAEQLYRDAFPWLEAFGTAKGKCDAGVDVVQLPREVPSQGHYNIHRMQMITKVEFQEKFREALRDLLGKQQQRVMGKLVKRKKTAKKAVV